jgi:catechol 2,3-dioxygenase-like lactoylglutathione lyase family enzyme
MVRPIRSMYSCPVTLSAFPLTTSVAVASMPRAVDFYEGRLGLVVLAEEPDGGRIYSCARGTTLHIYPSPDHAGSATSTVATWQVDDVDRAVDELAAEGVVFEHRDAGLLTDYRGIALVGDGKLAWFKDPDGNTFALVQ